jgi:hypothetical protein
MKNLQEQSVRELDENLMLKESIGKGRMWLTVGQLVRVDLIRMAYALNPSMQTEVMHDVLITNQYQPRIRISKSGKDEM